MQAHREPFLRTLGPTKDSNYLNHNRSNVASESATSVKQARYKQLPTQGSLAGQTLTRGGGSGEVPLITK